MLLLIILILLLFIWDTVEISMRNIETNERYEKKRHQWKFTNIDKN